MPVAAREGSGSKSQVSLHSGAAWSTPRSRPLVSLLLLGPQRALLGHKFSQGTAEAQPQPPGGSPTGGRAQWTLLTPGHAPYLVNFIWISTLEAKGTENGQVVREERHIPDPCRRMTAQSAPHVSSAGCILHSTLL